MNSLKWIVLVLSTSLLLVCGIVRADSDLSSAAAMQLTEQTQSVNVNTADAETLIQGLKGVGTKRAQAIIDYRETHGDFKSAEDLMLVKGLGPKFFENNKHKLRF